MLPTFHLDNQGSVVTTEFVMIVVISVLAMVVGLGEVAIALNSDMNGISASPEEPEPVDIKVKVPQQRGPLRQTAEMKDRDASPRETSSNDGTRIYGGRGQPDRNRAIPQL
jgi:hypothetical protein